MKTYSSTFREILGNTRLMWITALFFTLVYMMQVILNHYFFRSYAFDYALMNNAIWDFAHFQGNQNTIFIPPLKTFFQDHIAFTLILILPLFWILSPFFGTYTLLIIQVLFISAGGIGVYKFIRHLSGKKFIAYLAMLHYFVLQGHFATLSADYHDVVVGSAMISWFVYFFYREKYLPATLVFIFCMVSKENIPVWLVFVVPVLMLEKKTRKAYINGTGLIVLAAVYFVFAYWVLVPYFEDPERPHWTFRYTFFGDTPGGVIKYWLTHPFDTFLKMFYNHTGHELGNFVKLEYYTYFLIGGGWILFRRPVLLLFFLPLLAQKMLMDPVNRWTIGAYHSVEIESVYSLAIFMVISKIKKPKNQWILAVVILVMTMASSVYAMNKRHTYRYHEEKENIFSKKMYSTEFDIPEINKVLKQIPGDATVTGTGNVIPHFSLRDNVYVLPQIFDSEYIIMLENGNPFPMKQPDYLALKEKLFLDEKWEIHYNDPPLIILKRKEAGNHD